MIYVQLSISSARVTARHAEFTFFGGAERRLECADTNMPARVHTGTRASQGRNFVFPFRREGEGGRQAWHVRSNLLSAVARSPGTVICPLGRR